MKEGGENVIARGWEKLEVYGWHFYPPKQSRLTPEIASFHSVPVAMTTEGKSAFFVPARGVGKRRRSQETGVRSQNEERNC